MLFYFILTLPKNLKITRYNDFLKKFNVLPIITICYRDLLFREKWF